MFLITLTQGRARDITDFSSYGDGGREVLLPLACRFRADDCITFDDGLTVISVTELESDEDRI